MQFAYVFMFEIFKETEIKICLWSHIFKDNKITTMELNLFDFIRFINYQNLSENGLCEIFRLKIQIIIQIKKNFKSG